jgi:hypothetical protein
MKSELKYIFSNVNEWLKFAETKNAALIVFSASIILAILTNITNNINIILKYYIIICLIFQIISLIISLISFYPTIKISHILCKRNEISEKDNLLFYGNIFKYDEKMYLKSIFNDKVENTTRFELDLAKQIIINSNITLKKYKFFKLSLWFSISGIVTPIGGFLILLLCRE